MSNWIKTNEYDWRDKAHCLAFYGVAQYLNLDTGDCRYVHNGKLYVWDKDKKDYVIYEEQL